MSLAAPGEIPVPQAGPEHKMNVPFSYQLILLLALLFALNEMMIAGVIGFPKGVLLEAMRLRVALLQATVAGMAVPLVCRKPGPDKTEGQVIEQSVGGPPVCVKLIKPAAFE